jgi:FkbM family methyltransferase
MLIKIKNKIRQLGISFFRVMKKYFSGYGLYKIYPIKLLVDKIISLLKKTDKPVDVQGHMMYLDEMDSLMLSVNKGVFESVETHLITSSIKEGDVVIDIGANIGYFTLILARLVGDKGKVFAFEPEPTNFALLRKNVEMNGYKNVVLVQKAVSDKNELTKLYLSESNKGDHQMYKTDDQRSSIDIESITLDHYFEEKDKKVDFIKIDIQGSEHRAFKGMADILSKNNSIQILTELWPYALEQNGSSVDEVLNILGGHNFYFYDTTFLQSGQVEASDLLLRYRDDTEVEGGTNLWCTKNIKFSSNI